MRSTEIPSLSTKEDEEFQEWRGPPEALQRINSSARFIIYQRLIGDVRNGFALSINKAWGPDQIHNIRQLLEKLNRSCMQPEKVLELSARKRLNMPGIMSYLERISITAGSYGTYSAQAQKWGTIHQTGFSDDRGIYARHNFLRESLFETAHVARISSLWLNSMANLGFARRVYSQIRAPTISLNIIEKPLHGFEWTLDPKSRAQIFACITALESGGRYVNPRALTSVMALSSRNSIFVASAILSDPAESAESGDIKRIPGNVGQPGITLMVSAQNLRIRPPSQNFRAVTHADYDYQRVDRFVGTTLHLSFTKWKLPLNEGPHNQGLIDQDISIAEAVVSVRDSGRWVADIDILGAQLENFILTADCHCQRSSSAFKGAYTSIDKWDELLDPQLTPAIVRTHGNWAARLAAICVLKQKNMSSRAGVVRKDTTCLACLGAAYWEGQQSSAFFID